MRTIFASIKFKRWSYGCLLLLLPACHPGAKENRLSYSPALLAADFKLIDSAKELVNNGDVIFRNGNDEVSQAARSMNRKDTSFSHCGLVFIEHDSVFVYHALGGSYNPSQKLRRDLIDSFCTPTENNAFGIYRYNLKKEEQQKLQATVYDYYKAGLKFDMYFNFFTDDKMYCSEFVFKSLNKSMNGALTRYIRLDTIPYGVTTDDLFLNKNCKLVKREIFKL